MTPYPLGRRVNHDPRSLSFPAQVSSDHRPVAHRHYGPILDQGELGSCTGNAMVNVLNCTPIRQMGKVYYEQDAVEIYAAATRIDPYPGSYKPTDTGSDGLSVCKVAKARGLIDSYSHAFGLDMALGALQLQPVLLGVTWHESMFTPDKKGFIHPDGNVAGGHEVMLLKDSANGWVEGLNNWSAVWGLRGRFRLTYEDLRALLKDQGDVTVPVRTKK